MLFTSPVFLLFFLIVFLLCRTRMPWGVRKAILLIASYAFYAAWNPPFVLLIWLSTAVDWLVAARMARTEGRKRKFLLVISLVVNLGLLATFKYAGFFADNFVVIASWLGHDVTLMQWSIVLPVGISFYTFQTLSYTIDVYRKKIDPEPNPLDFALFVTFFPQLVAGPIVRASEFLPQLKKPRRALPKQVYWGAVLFIVGLFKKVFLADTVFGPVVAAGYSLESASLVDAWIATYAFAGQLFCDFSGYSDMAIGLALALGFAIPDNFHTPFGSISITDHWRRWHMSLSSWLRDYLYISLGGNRRGRFRTYLNLALTMLLGGLWHGAAWTYVAWGGLNGMYLALERRFQIAWLSNLLHSSRGARVAAMILTFHMACLGYVFFRANDIGQAFSFLGSMFGAGSELFTTVISRRMSLVALAAIALLVAQHMVMRNTRLETVARRVGWKVTAVAAGVMLFLVITAGGGGHAFIYFQF
ncbi:MAG: MBOAT family O-acyltransferase [Planctomycetota bacterium]|jgi:alginate O-acetyltransferase complex protein AlgI